jgi:Patatin-like phospholipase
VRPVSEQCGTRAPTATLGRLGGLTTTEADRGERALLLSGQGYRAALFHLGALTRLNELGLLAQVSTVGAVSGGSILAALLATRVPWPLHGAFREWREQVAGPLRTIAQRNLRARALFRRPSPSTPEAALEEGYARELVESLGGESGQGPHFVFGASGLMLSGLAAAWEDCVEWELDASVHPPGYPPEFVASTIAAVRTDLDAFAEAEQAILENHGYLLADAALRERGLAGSGGVEGLPPEPPHPRWMNEERVRGALAAGPRRKMVGRLRPHRARRGGGRALEPTGEGLTALLQRHRPFLQYDSLENFRAVSAATICEFATAGRANSLHRSDGSLIASAQPSHGEPRLDLAFLGSSYGDGGPVRPDDYLDECGGSHAADALEMRLQAEAEDVVYGRARRDGRGRLWLQYWLSFYFADRGLLGLEQHEGDWQVFQIRLDADDQPDAATFARSSSADRLGWGQVRRAESGDGPAAVVHPARGSHAPLPRPGTFRAPVVPDHSDGAGALVRPRLVAIGDDGPGWVLWPGRWGATRRREHFEGESPRGPREHSSWWEPAELHREARPWSEPVAAEAALVAAAPPPFTLEARRDGNLAIVDYRFEEPDRERREPTRIVAVPVDAEGEVGVARPFPLEGRKGSLAIQLPAQREWRGIRAAAASALGVPGGCRTVHLA